MSRRKAAPVRDILPDPLFKSELLAKFINCVMRSGKKSVAERIVYGALDIIVDKAELTAKPADRRAQADGEDARGEGGDSGSGAASNQPIGSIRDSDRARKKALDVFQAALDNVTPSVEVKSRRVGGSTYQVPVEVRPKRRTALGMRWLVEFASKRNEKSMVQRLAAEMMDAIHGRGNAVKKREDVHRMAKANQAFAHFRW